MLVRGQEAQGGRIGHVVRWLAIIPLAVGGVFDGWHPTGQAAAVRDSAGIRIVENRLPALDSTRAWRLDPRPTLTIGSVGGDTAYQFSEVFVAGRLSNGEFIVADSRSRTVRFFTAGGRIARSIGGPGQGPSEFPRTFFSAFLCGDSAFVRLTDYGQRVIVVSPRPQFARELESPRSPDGARTDIAGCGRGRILWAITPGSSPGRTVPGLNAPRTTRFGVTDAAGKWLGATPAMIAGGFYAVPGAGGDGAGFLILTPPLQPRLAMAIASTGVFASGQRAFEITQYGFDGRLRMIVRARQDARFVTRPDRDRIVRQMLDTVRSPAVRTGYQRMLDDPALPSTIPAIGEMLVDSEDNLWVREYDQTDMQLSRPPAADHTRRWAVFAPDGHLVTHVVTPLRVQLRQVGRDFVLGVRYDDDGVPFIQTWRLLK